MDTVIYGVLGLQGFLLFLCASRAFWVYGRLLRESAVLAQVPTEGQDLGQFSPQERWDDVLSQSAAKGSFAATRWQDLSGMVAATGNVPTDQSSLDDELEDELDEYSSPVKSTAGLAVLVGLAGTLYGLTIGVQNLNGAMPKTGQNLNLADFADKMGQTISGFGSAFYSAGAGVVNAIVIGMLGMWIQGQCARFVKEFRRSARTDLVRLLPHNANRVELLDQLNNLARVLRQVEKRLPDVEAMQTVLESIREVDEELKTSAQAVVSAYERATVALDKPNTITRSLDRLEILLETQSQKSHEVIASTMEAIQAAAKKQTEISEEVARLIIDMPIEVSSQRLIVSDRSEFQRLNRLLESKIDTAISVAKQTSTKVDSVANRETIFDKIWARVRGNGASA